MTDNTTIMGAVLEPYDGTAVFPGFYTGPVSIRDHGDYLEVGFFAPLSSPRRPTKGEVNGVDVTVTGVATRLLDPQSSAPRPRGSLHSIIASVIPVTPA